MGKIFFISSFISLLHESLLKFKSELSSKFEIFQKTCSIYTERSNNSIIQQPDFISSIDNKLSLVTEKVKAETERKLREKKSSKCYHFQYSGKL